MLLVLADVVAHLDLRNLQAGVLSASGLNVEVAGLRQYLVHRRRCGTHQGLSTAMMLLIYSRYFYQLAVEAVCRASCSL